MTKVNKPTIGLLPLYLALYDETSPEARPRINEFYSTIARELGSRELEVVTADVCRIKSEFDRAVSGFEKAGVDAIVTLHLAYSPSLECSEALSRTHLPVIVLDTTPTFSFAPGQDPAEIMYNHGIHGVQDMCNLLIRNGKPFEIEAGHWEKSDVLDRVAAWARAARVASNMRSAKVGRIGIPFVGMGDFAVPENVLKSTIGVETLAADFTELKSLMPNDEDPLVDAEMAEDARRFSSDGLDRDAHRRTTRTCLAVRRWIETKGLSAFTVNFDVIDESTGLGTLPFLEASKAMGRGIGYAGEGDVLTAAMVGALAAVYPDTTFTEMFCPDWENDTLFLSHMGEANPNLLTGEIVLKQKNMSFLKVESPVMVFGRFRGGQAVFVDLAPGPDDTYTLIAIPVTVIDDDNRDTMTDTVRGWIQPNLPISDVLEEYSRLGGTHHAALVYGDKQEDIIRFGQLMGWDVAVLG